MKIKCIVKESWRFHGFGSGAHPMDVVEFINPYKTFKFHYVQIFLPLLWSIKRVSCMGWPVSDYKVEVVSEEEMETMKAEATYSEYYKCYMEKGKL